MTMPNLSQAGHSMKCTSPFNYLYPLKEQLMDTYDTKQQGNTQRIVGEKPSYRDHVGPGPEIMAADTLAGNAVVNAAREDLGEIEHIMLDVPRGRIAYAVLSFGGFLGMGEKLFAIPWHALKLDVANKCFILDASKEQLQNAPGFDKDRWPSMADQKWAQDIHSYYSSAPYWE
jgi:sporulation protein YlmC with PRC-barrel domain